MTLGIIAAMEQEINRLVNELSDVKTYEKANQTFYEGRLYNQKVILVKSGIGKVNASIAATLLINQFNVSAVINTGSAGGVQSGLAIGDLVLSTELSYNDVDARTFGYTFGQVPQMPVSYQADEVLAEQFAQAAKKNEWSIQRGLIVTGDSFISNQNQLNRIKEEFPRALVTEMEGAAIAQTCYQFDVPFLVIRAVSDSADEEAGMSFDEFIELAGKQSAETVLTFVQSL